MRTIIILFTALMIISCNDTNEIIDTSNLEDTSWAGIQYVINDSPYLTNRIYEPIPNQISFQSDGKYSYGGLSQNWTFRNESLILEGIYKSTILEYDGETMTIEFVIKKGNSYYAGLSNMIYVTPDEDVIITQQFRRME